MSRAVRFERLRWTAGLLVLASCGPQDDSPDTPGLLVIPDAVACEECEIVLEERALLGDPLDPTSIREDASGRGCMVTELSTGAYVSSGAVGGGRLYVYEGSGPAVRTIGRPGQGPGEFGGQLRVTSGPNDTLYIVDELNARLQVMTAEGDFVRALPLPARYRPFTRLTTGSFLFHRTPTSTEDLLFHLIDGAGNSEASFGRPTLTEYDLETWIVSPSEAGGFWTASAWHYELYRSEGPDTVNLTVRRSAPWFPGGVWWTENLYARDPPGPMLIHLWEDEQRRLWVYSGVADTNWEPNEMKVPDPEWQRANFDVIIEILDLDKGAVLARRRIDDMLGPVCNSPLMYSVIRAADGDTRARIVTPRLIQPTGS